MQTIIKNATILDPSGIKGDLDIFIEKGVIRALVPAGATDRPAWDHERVERIDAEGLFVFPGLVDMHVHLREPGHEYKETILSGTLAAVRGGFTTVCCMPNTNPVNDCEQVTRYILEKAKEAGYARVLPTGAISRGLLGKELSDYMELADAGAVAVSDDGKPVTDSLFMRRAMEYAYGAGLLVISHCEDLFLAGAGCMNEGKTATAMGLLGIPNAAEAVIVAREILLSELAGVPVHLAHISTKESLDLIRAAKARGTAVTAETAPHYFTLTEDAVLGYNTHAKMNPPLRTERDRRAVIAGLVDGTIDVIATDHAPHSDMEKDLEFDKAANGIIGLETAFCLGMGLVESGVLSLEDLIRKMSTNPAQILGLDTGIREGAAADLTFADIKRSYVIDASKFASKSRNTPFHGRKVSGKIIMTMVAGRLVYREPV